MNPEQGHEHERASSSGKARSLIVGFWVFDIRLRMFDSRSRSTPRLSVLIWTNKTYPLSLRFQSGI